MSGTGPLPPTDIMERSLPVRVLTKPVLFRGHHSHHDPLHFNIERGRWTDLDGKTGTLYLGAHPNCAFAEAFIQLGDTSSWPVFVSERYLHGCCLCPVTANGSLRLVDVTSGPALMQLGADDRINSGPHSVSRIWARAFRQHPSQPDGVYYRSRRSPELFSVAVFERALPALTTDCSRNLLVSPEQLAKILDYFDCALLP